jgi:hypothetical protein
MIELSGQEPLMIDWLDSLYRGDERIAGGDAL